MFPDRNLHVRFFQKACALVNSVAFGKHGTHRIELAGLTAVGLGSFLIDRMQVVYHGAVQQTKGTV